MRNPVESINDVLTTLPYEVKEVKVAPIRDAFVESALELFQEVQDKFQYAAEQSDPLKATEIYLDQLGRDREVNRGTGESDEDYRNRIFTPLEVVTPSAILGIANGIVSRYTTILPQYFESELDRWFVSSTFSSFIGASPYYPDRLFPNESVENGGYVRVQSEPRTAWVFGTDVGRYFVLQLPPLSAADDQFAFISTSDVTSFISTTSTHTTYMFTNSLTESEAYNLLISRINKIIGQGIRYQLYVNPELI